MTDRTFDLLLQKNDECVLLQKALDEILSIIREANIDYFDKINRIETIARGTILK